MSSLVKKYLMAISGLVLVLFVLVHMLGNLQFFAGPEAINAYAWHLRHMPGGMGTLWAARIILLICLIVHVWMAVLLTAENKKARPKSYAVKHSAVAGYAARTMPITGIILLAFIILHLLMFTMRIVPQNYDKVIGSALINVNDHTIHYFDVFAMIVKAFSSPLFALIYIFAVALLCMHLSHGVSSMFQSVGWRNELWRRRLNCFARLFGFIIFLGFAAIPLSVLAFGYGKAYLHKMDQQWSEQVAMTSSAHHFQNK